MGEVLLAYEDKLIARELHRYEHEQLLWACGRMKDAPTAPAILRED